MARRNAPVAVRSASRGIAGKGARIVVALMLATCMTLMLGGCKYTDVLTQAFYDQENGELDESAEPIQQLLPSDEKVEGTEQLSESDRDIDQREKPQENPEASNEDEADRAKEISQTPDARPEDDSARGKSDASGTGDGSNASGNGGAGTGRGYNGEAGTAEGGASSGTGGGQAGASSPRPSDAVQDTGDNQQGSEQDQQQETPTPAPATPGGSTGTGGSGGTARTWSAGGRNADLPRDVHRVAAVGQYALIVQMLSGADESHKSPLVATDAAFLERVARTGAFPGEGMNSENVAVAWTGSEEEGWHLDLDVLMAAKPDTVLLGSKSGILDDQVAADLVDAGVNVVILPQLGDPYTMDEDIDRAVAYIGEVLKDANTKYSTVSAAQDYANFKERVVSTQLALNGGYSAFVSTRYGWGSSLDYILQGDGVKGTAASNMVGVKAYTAYFDGWVTGKETPLWLETRYKQSHWYHLFPYRNGITTNGYLSNAYLLDGYPASIDISGGLAVSLPKSTIDGNAWPIIDYYLQTCGVMDSMAELHKLSFENSYNSDQRLDIDGMYGSYFTPWMNVASWDIEAVNSSNVLCFPVTANAGNYSSYVVCGQTESFPGVIVRDSSTAELVQAAGGSCGVYDTGYDYTAWVVPSGLAGSWVDGSIESFFISEWAYGIFRNGQDGPYCANDLNDFCWKFYRCASSDAMDASSGAAYPVKTANTQDLSPVVDTI